MHVKRSLAVLLAVAATLGLAGWAGAHGEGNVTVAEKEAVEKGKEAVELLVRRGKLDESWSRAILDTAELKVTGPRQWHLVFRNDGVEDMGKARLFVFLTAGGELLGTSFTGEAR